MTARAHGSERAHHLHDVVSLGINWIGMRASPATMRILGALNRLPIGARSVRICTDRLYADSLDRYVAALGWKFGWLEAPEHALICREVCRGMVAVDVGANVGFHTLGLARCVGQSGRVHALEPDPRNFRLLSRAVREAGLWQVHLHQAAAAQRSGLATLYVSGVNRGDHRLTPGDDGRQPVSVVAVVLDELLAGEPRVDFVKIDVQGAEVAVLHGLRRTLQRSPAAGVLCEISPGLLRRAGTAAPDFFDPLHAAGFAPHRLRRNGTLEAITEAEAWAAAESAGYLNLFFRAATRPGPA